MQILPLALLALILIVPIQSVYLPELQACASTTFINKQITQFGPTIQKQLNDAKIPDQHFDDKFDGVHVQFNLSAIKQHFGINWKANVISIQDQQTFILNSKNINMNMTGHIQFKIGFGLKQKGQLDITIDKIQADTTLQFTQPHCNSTSNKGIGFDIQINKLFVNTQKIIIKIQHKGLDNLIIKAVMSVLKSRLPSIIEKAAHQKGNPAISKATCSPIQQYFSLGTASYVAIINTTNIPHFSGKDLYASLDLTFVNAATNSTNSQVQNDNLPESNIFEAQTQISFLASSNMMNSVLWLVDDSQVLSINVTNDKLPPDAPIELNTLNLSILIPGLLQYGRKEVILLIQTSNKFSHLYIRNGKLVASISLSIKFVVNKTGQGEPVKECISQKHCIMACDLNTTIPLSIAINIRSNNTVKGLLHSVSIEQIKTIQSNIPVKPEQLGKILNAMIGSFRPQINQLIQKGIPIDVSKFEKFGVDSIFMQTKKDYLGLGIAFKK